MSTPRQYALVAIAFVVLPAAAHAYGGKPISQWQQNGSTLQLFADGATRNLVYDKPRAGIGGEGVKSGTRLFQGTQSGNTFSGTAYVFSKRCGALPYAVRGKLSTDGRLLTLEGMVAAALDDDCKPTRYQPDLLKLDLLQTYQAVDTPPQQQQPTPSQTVDTNPEGEQDGIKQTDLERGKAELRAQQALIEKLQTENAKLRTDAARLNDASQPAKLQGTLNAAPNSTGTSPITVGSITHRSVADAPAWLPIAITAMLTSLAGLAILVYRNPNSFNFFATAATRYASAAQSSTATIVGAIAKTAAMPASIAFLTPASAASEFQSLQASHGRDTPGALIAMGLANSYIDDVRDGECPDFDQDDLRRKQLSTLSLAARQIDLAEELDPDAILQIVGETGDASAITITQLKARVLYYEGLMHRYFDTRMSVPALAKAIELDPDNAAAHYLLGCIHAANKNKPAAIAALENAVELNPRNMESSKALLRAQAMTDAE